MIIDPDVLKSELWDVKLWQCSKKASLEEKMSTCHARYNKDTDAV